MTTIAAPSSETLHFHAPASAIHKKLLLVSAILGPVAIIAPMSGGKYAGAMFVFALGMWAVCAAAVWAAMRYTRLSITRDGVVFRTLGYSIEASWDNIIGIRTERLHRQGEVDGLVLREIGFRANGVLMFFALFSFSASLSLSEQEYFLPISNVLTDAWWYSPFGNALRERAPHLFE